MFGIVTIIGLILIPSITKNLKGPWKVYIFLQLISVMAYLIFSVIPLFFNYNFLDLGRLRDLPLGVDKAAVFDLPLRSYVNLEIFLLFKHISYHEFSIISFIQSNDIKIMICHPFDYKEYSRPKCIVHRICLGCLFGCILGCDNLAKIFINLKRVWESQDVDVSYQLIENFEFAMCKMSSL